MAKLNMKKSLRIGLIIAGLIIVSGLIAVVKTKQTKAPELILFYSNYCPHCKNVEKYISDNDLKNKITFTELEVADNQANAQILVSQAKKCGLDTNGIGVPLFYDGTNCLIGDTNIINYFATKK